MKSNENPWPKELPWVLDNETIAHVYPKGSRPNLEVAEGFSFILNVSKLATKGKRKQLLAHGHELRRANSSEISAIKDVLEGFKLTIAASQHPLQKA
jgi:hypothetical protein